MNRKKGFTLIELLIVIGILAILAVAAVLVLNPAEILRQARDSQRISDLSSVKSAIALYLSTTTSTPSLIGTSNQSFCTLSTTCPLSSGTCTSVPTSTLTAVNGNGWVTANLTLTSGGSALGALPVDPSNNSSSSQYCYKADNTSMTFKLTGFLESTKYQPLMTTDGGSNSNSTSTYEIGTGLSL